MVNPAGISHREVEIAPTIEPDCVLGVCYFEALVGIVSLVGENVKLWVQGDDDLVRTHLKSELETAQSATSPGEVLDVGTDGARAAFLQATKIYHPNRFARRPGDIRKLANELYICIKEAYEELKAQEDAIPEQVKRAETSPLIPVSDRGGSPDKPARENTVDESDARKQLAARRRERVKQRLGASSELPALGRTTPAKGAQIRTATQPTIEAPSDLEIEETQFKSALMQLGAQKYSDASVAFKKLAVVRPTDKRYRMHMHYCQGKYHQSADRFPEARSEYQRALGLDANFKLAHKAMASLPKDPEKKKSGLLSRLFRK